MTESEGHINEKPLKGPTLDNSINAVLEDMQKRILALESPHKEIKASRVALHDRRGRLRVVLSTFMDKAGVCVIDENGHPAVALTSLDKAGRLDGRVENSIALWHQSGDPTTVVHLRTTEEGFALLTKPSVKVVQPDD